ncbi:hypothetical protein [Proteiniphilum sp.]|uniref:hypothetical protein n=1 Tax=Proteiniphilum sp. TaxID=1926877 RepID=UPI0033304A03
MKNLYLKSGLIALTLLSWSCSDDKIDNDTSYAKFLRTSLEVSQSAGEVIIMIEWSATQWEIVMDTDIGMVTYISQTNGERSGNEKDYAQIKIRYSGNSTLESRTQEIFLVNKRNGERSMLEIEQEAAYTPLSVTLYPTVRYQHVVGFGGMYNPKIWIQMITETEMNKMYGPGGLGYTVLRLMVYPNEADWSADIEGAKLAQLNGTIIFATPWESPEDLSETIKDGDREYKRLKTENYQAYTDHLVKYINYMKGQGVNLYAVSMQNEPDLGFFWRPEEIVSYLKGYGSQIRATGVKLMAPEACGFHPEYSDPILNDPEAFNNTDILAGHLYQGFIDLENGYVRDRYNYVSGLYDRKLAAAGKTWWMTEMYHNDEGKDLDAIWKFQQDNFGKEIHMSMEAYCSAYVYWYLKRSGGQCGMIDDPGSTVSVNDKGIAKDGYILSHYAQYASNMTRVKVETGDPDVLATAYVNEDGREMTVVMLNMKEKGFNARIISPSKVKEGSAVETTKEKDMVSVSATFSSDGLTTSVLLSARSIVSVRLKL